MKRTRSDLPLDPAHPSFPAVVRANTASPAASCHPKPRVRANIGRAAIAFFNHRRVEAVDVPDEISFQSRDLGKVGLGDADAMLDRLSQVSRDKVEHRHVRLDRA